MHRSAGPFQYRDRDLHAIWWAVAIPFSLTIVLGLLSEGVRHDDELVHFLMARWARWFPAYLLHPWGRPGLTVPLAVVAWIGDVDVAWHAARFMSACVTAATAVLAARLAAALDVPRPWLVGVACAVQPLNTVLACTTLTENFAAFYLMAAVVQLHRRRVVWASAFFSLALVTRHEAVVFLPMWWLAMATAQGSGMRRAVGSLVALWAPAVHNVLLRLCVGAWAGGAFLQPHGSTEYPPLGLLGYLPQALHAIPPVVMGLAVIGGVVWVRRGRWLIPAFAVCFLLAHVAIKAVGVYASGGYGRFMVTVAPFVSILAVSGLHAMAGRPHGESSRRSGWLVLGGVWVIGWVAFEIERRTGRLTVPDGRLVWLASGLTVAVVALTVASWAAGEGGRGAVVRRIVACALALTCLVQWAWVVRPLRPGAHQEQVRRVVDWLVERELDQGPVFAANPWVIHCLGLVEDPRAHKDARLLASMPVGTVLVWDSVYSESDYHGLALATIREDEGYEPIGSFAGTQGGGVEMHVFRKIKQTPVPRNLRPAYPRNLMSEKAPVSGVFYIRTGGR